MQVSTVLGNVQLRVRTLSRPVRLLNTFVYSRTSYRGMLPPGCRCQMYVGGRFNPPSGAQFLAVAIKGERRDLITAVSCAFRPRIFT